MNRILGFQKKQFFQFLILLIFIVNFFADHLFAVSVNDMITLKNSGVSEGLIISKFNEQKVRQILTIDDLLKLQKAGFSGSSINILSGYENPGSGKNVVNYSQIETNQIHESSAQINSSQPAFDRSKTFSNTAQNRITVVAQSPIPTPGTLVIGERHGYFEVKNHYANAISIYIDSAARHIFINKNSSSFSGNRVEPYSSKIFRLPLGNYSIDVENENYTYYVDVTPAGAELILAREKANSDRFFNMVIRVMGRKIFSPVKYRHKYYKPGYNKKYNHHKGRPVKKYYRKSYYY
jgi:hypothetical protein